MFRPRCSTKMYHVPGLIAALLQSLCRTKMTAQIGKRLTLRLSRRENRKASIVGFFIHVSSLEVFGHSIYSERRRIYVGKLIQALQNDTIIIS